MNQLKHLFTLCLVVLTSTVTAASSSFSEGQDYTKLPSSVRTEAPVAELIANNPKKVQLLFFFSYGCSACAKFDPSFEKWATTHQYNKLVIYREPVSFEDDWEMLAKLYFVMKTLDPKQDLNPKIFTAIHDQGLKLWQESAMQEFFTKQGYSAASFDQAYKSYNVELDVKRSDALAKAFDVNQTPCVIINGASGSYLLTMDHADGNASKFLQILDYMIKTEEKKISTPT